MFDGISRGFLFLKKDSLVVHEETDPFLKTRVTCSSCPDAKQYRSKWGYCGTGVDYCGDKA